MLNVPSQAGTIMSKGMIDTFLMLIWHVFKQKPRDVDILLECLS